MKLLDRFLVWLTARALVHDFRALGKTDEEIAALLDATEAAKPDKRLGSIARRGRRMIQP